MLSITVGVVLSAIVVEVVVVKLIRNKDLTRDLRLNDY